MCSMMCALGGGVVYLVVVEMVEVLKRASVLISLGHLDCI